MAKFSLLTVLLLFLGMLYFGREAGLPEHKIGRETSLWAELFGGGGVGALDLLTEPAAAPVAEPAPEIIAQPELPAADDAPRTAALEPESAPETDLETGQAPTEEQVVGSERAPVRSLRPLPRPDVPVTVAEVEAAPAATRDEAGETDPVEEVLEAVLAEEPILPAPEETPEAALEPEAETIAASTFAPEVTPRPLAKPEPPALPAAVVEPEPAPVAEAIATPEAPEETPATEAADLAATALETLPVTAEPVTLPEPAAEPAPDVTAPEVVETVEAAPETAPVAEPVVEDVSVEAAVETALAEADAAVEAIENADVGPVIDPASSLRPLPRPLQALDPVPAEELSVPAPELAAAPEPEPLPVEEPVVEALPETEADDTGDSAEITAAPLPDPEPAPVVPLLPDAPQGVLYVSSADVTVRAGPSTSDRAVDEMPRGSAVVDLGGDGDGWRMILLPNGAAGYIPDTEVSLTPGQ